MNQHKPNVYQSPIPLSKEQNQLKMLTEQQQPYFWICGAKVQD